jgi:hypothetical protein
MRFRLPQVALALLALIAIPPLLPTAKADTITLGSSRDATIYQNGKIGHALQARVAGPGFTRLGQPEDDRPFGLVDRGSRLRQLGSHRARNRSSSGQAGEHRQGSPPRGDPTRLAVMR